MIFLALLFFLPGSASTAELKTVTLHEVSPYDRFVSHSWRHGPPNRELSKPTFKAKKRIIDFEANAYEASFNVNKLDITVSSLPERKPVLQNKLRLRECSCLGPMDQSTYPGGYPVRVVESGRYFVRLHIVGIVCCFFQHRKTFQTDIEVHAWPDCFAIVFNNSPVVRYCDSHGYADIHTIQAKTGSLLAPASLSASSLHMVQNIPLPNEAGLHACYADPEFSAFNVTLTNAESREKITRVVFKRRQGGIGITGVIPVLFEGGAPSGAFVQISKNWHADNRIKYADKWFEAVVFFQLPSRSRLRFQLRLFYGGVSHSQLSLVGWGVNDLWDQVGHGCNGESITYEPNRNHRDTFVCDIRPVFTCALGSTENDCIKGGWTENVGGADFGRCLDNAGVRLAETRVRRAPYMSPGPLMTNATYLSVLGKNAAKMKRTVATVFSDDIARHIHSFELTQVKRRRMLYSKVELYSLGTDYYANVDDLTMWYGDAAGLLGKVEVTKPQRFSFRRRHALPFWIAIDGTQLRGHPSRPLNSFRGLVVRDLQNLDPRKLKIRAIRAVGGGWRISLYARNVQVRASRPLRASFSLIVPPKHSFGYWGSDPATVSLLRSKQIWQMVFREAVSYNLRVNVAKGGGTLESAYPVRVIASANCSMSIASTIPPTNFIPITFITHAKPSLDAAIFINGTRQVVLSQLTRCPRGKYEITFNVKMNATNAFVDYYHN